MRLPILVFFIFFSGRIFAGCDSNGCVGTPKELFSNYYLSGWDDGRVFFQLVLDKDKLDCDLVEGSYLTLRSGHPLFKEIYSSVLLASAADRKILLRIKNGSDICEISYVRFYN